MYTRIALDLRAKSPRQRYWVFAKGEYKRSLYPWCHLDLCQSTLSAEYYHIPGN